MILKNKNNLVMGLRGDKMMRTSVLAAELLVEKPISIYRKLIKKMFSGHGVFHEG